MPQNAVSVASNATASPAVTAAVLLLLLLLLLLPLVSPADVHVSLKIK